MNPTLENDVQFYLSPGAMWDAFYDDCEKAQTSITLEQYILEHDDTGKRFMTLFAEKARQGVTVHLLLDFIGSQTLMNTDLHKEAEKAGVKVVFYNPLAWMDFFLASKWLPRNHAKVAVIDNAVAYIGSACMNEGMRYWRDTHLRVTGELAKGIIRHFMPGADYSSPNEFKYLMTEPHMQFNPIYKELKHAIDNAKHSVCLVSPYFMPPFGLRRSLRRASKRGVNVTIMMSEKTDVRSADHVAHSYFPWYLRNKIRVLLYEPTVLHAKYVIVDDDWATIGSTNMDFLSLLYNRETNIFIRHKPTIATLQQQFDADMEKCRSDIAQYWKSIPWHNKLIGYACRSLKRFFHI